ncbi:hypothetical protein [Peterkaempfera sp. SMS 1(5)a]|uniref:hypothetical protein n=1 Tax=Peterkaempfera podocarpi TaxID=3232308 RepID=UPI0036701831
MAAVAAAAVEAAVSPSLLAALRTAALLAAPGGPLAPALLPALLLLNGSGVLHRGGVWSSVPGELSAPAGRAAVATALTMTLIGCLAEQWPTLAAPRPFTAVVLGGTATAFTVTAALLGAPGLRTPMRTAGRAVRPTAEGARRHGR